LRHRNFFGEKLLFGVTGRKVNYRLNKRMPCILGITYLLMVIQFIVILDLCDAFQTVYGKEQQKVRIEEKECKDTMGQESWKVET